ncbi:uncharacterized protein LOC135833336 isoform X2 [Planococcus citri]|uniref:uncharacterized protein LOC135833336 isoform X2 n=1 Tax=Planococcus citri TaxID=170843 RepID=UPI0031F9D8DE
MINQSELSISQVFAYEEFIEPGNTTLSSDGTITHIAPLNIRSRIKCTASSSSQLSDIYDCKLNFKMNIFRANISFSHNNYSDVISPWIITKTPPTIIRFSEKNETELLKKSIQIDLTLKRSISQPKSCSEFASNSSEKLRCQLFSNYSYKTSNMASQDLFQTLNLTIFYADIDVSGLFQMIGEVNVTWEDHQLTWEPSKYNNTYTLDLDMLNNSNQIWKPAYVLVNNLFYDNKPLLSSDHITTVTYQGKVTLWTKSISLQTKCPVLMRKRPWNEQICLLRFKTNVSDAKFDVKQGAKTGIESPWTVHEIMTRMNGSLESPDNSILLHVHLRRNIGYFKSTQCISSASSYEEELKCHLLTKVHPNISSVQAFAFGPGVDMMISYIELNLENGILLLKGQQTMIWEDKRMAWDPERFGDQFVIKMEEDALWKPCLVLDNELFQKGVNHGSYDNDDVVPTCNVGTGHLDVSSNGDVIWTSPMNLDTTCNMAFNSWPWDPQTCSLNFTTNTMDIKHLQVNLSRTELSITKSLWTITNITKEFDDNFRMRFEITLEMNSCSLQVTLCLIFIGVSLVMLPSFLISPVSRIKLASKTLSFLLLVIFLVILINSIPHFTTRAPNFLIGLAVLLSTVGISTFVTAYLVRLARESHSSNPSLNMEFANPEENKRENGTMKTVVINATTRTDNEYTAEVPALKKSQNQWLKIAAVIELSSFAICSIVVVFLIVSLMS